MIIGSYFSKIWNHLFLCKFQKRLLFNKLNNYLIINQKHYSKQINNNWFEFEFNNNKSKKSEMNLIKDIYREESFPLMPSLKSLSTDEMQTESENIFNFDNNKNNKTNGVNNEWFETLSFAERVVNYPTSFLSLRFLLKEEISYLAIHLKRLIDTKHPLLETAKNILRTNQQIRGLIVLLLSKSYSYPKHILDNFDSETNRSALISKHQRKLAEITDMIHVSQVLHRGIIDLPNNSLSIDNKLNEDLHLGNTISILIGDFLLANASRTLALLRNPTITGLVAKAIGNYSEAEFLKLELFKNNSLEMLEKYCSLSGGSLLGHCCKSAILLAEYDEDIQSDAFQIGKHIGIAFQLSDLLSRSLNFNNNNNNNEIELYDMNLVKSLLKMNINRALALIENLDQSEASLTLSKIVINIENVELVDVFQ